MLAGGAIVLTASLLASTRIEVDMEVIQPAFVEAGVWIRPFGKLVYTMPPYVIERADLSHLTGAIVRVVQEVLEA